MDNSSNKKRKKFQPFILWVFAFLFLTVFCFIFFTGCFSKIDPVILNLFRKVDIADHRISACIPALGPGIPSNKNYPGTIEVLNSSRINNKNPCTDIIFSQPGKAGINVEGEQSFLSLPATIKKFINKYASKDTGNHKIEENNQNVNSDSGNSGENTVNDGKDAEENQKDNLHTVASASLETQLLNIINHSRHNKNLSVLNYNSALNKIAMSRSTDMLNRGYFSHTTPDGKNIFIILQENGIGYLSAGENIYYSYPPSGATPEKAFSVWMGSSGHRANILSANYSQIGIGVESNNEKLVITLVFIN